MTFEVLFALIKSKVVIRGIELYTHLFLFIAYVDDSTFFLKDISSVKMSSKFSWFSELKPNITKCEIAGLVSLKGVLETVCGLNTVDLTNDANKILAMQFFPS